MDHATSLQVCMDTTNWLQGTVSEEISTGLNSSLSSPSGGATSECMLAAACSSRAGPPLMERRLRPPHDLHLKCPRCDSTHTKFCYYNNYSLSQPRYFCKTCRRYWTKGGTLRNIPVGGGCRKSSKKSTSKKPINNNDHQLHQSIITQGGSAPSNPSNDNLHLSFPQVQFPPHLANLIGAQMSLGGGNFLDNGTFLRPIDFMENKYEGLIGGYNFNRGNDFMGGNHNEAHEFGVIGGIEDNNLCDNNGGYKLGCPSPTTSTNGGYNGLTSTFSGINLSSSNTNIFDGNLGISYMDQRMLLPFDGNDNNTHQNASVDIKPNPKLLSLEWQDQGCNGNSNVGNGKNSSYGYNGNSWSGTMGGFQSSATNSLV